MICFLAFLQIEDVEKYNLPDSSFLDDIPLPSCRVGDAEIFDEVSLSVMR